MTSKWNSTGDVSWNDGDILYSADLNDTLEAISPQMGLTINNMNEVLNNASLNGTLTINSSETYYGDIIAENITITNNSTLTLNNSSDTFIICDTFQLDSGSILESDKESTGSDPSRFPGLIAGGASGGGSGDTGSDGGEGITGGGGVASVYTVTAGAGTGVTDQCKRSVISRLLWNRNSSSAHRANTDSFFPIRSGASGGKTGGGGNCGAGASTNIFIICNTATINGTINNKGDSGVSGNGGGGGGSGGVVGIYAGAFGGTGTIDVSGGNGGAGSTNPSGGGAGGNGGFILFLKKTAGQSSWGGTSTVTAGNGGSGTGDGVSGSNGNAGDSLTVELRT